MRSLFQANVGRVTFAICCCQSISGPKFDASACSVVHDSALDTSTACDRSLTANVEKKPWCISKICGGAGTPTGRGDNKEQPAERSVTSV